MVYPPAADYFFEPLNEHAQVYISAPARARPHHRRSQRSEDVAQMPSRLTLKGTLEYQVDENWLPGYIGPASVDRENQAMN